jgi:hypothetical protein
MGEYYIYGERMNSSALLSLSDRHPGRIPKNYEVQRILSEEGGEIRQLRNFPYVPSFMVRCTDITLEEALQIREKLSGKGKILVDIIDENGKNIMEVLGLKNQRGNLD